MNTLHFEKLSKFDRPAEPVTFGVPFPRGVLRDASRFGLGDRGKGVACQREVLTKWDDGSIKWLLIHSLIDLPGNAAKDMEFSADDKFSGAAGPAQRAQIVEESGGFRFTNGMLSFSIAKRGFSFFEGLSLRGNPILGDCSGGLVVTDGGGVSFSTAEDRAPSFQIEEAGPIRVALKMAGKHANGGKGFLDYVIRLVMWAGKPYVELDYQFINKEAEPSVAIRDIALLCRMGQRAGVQVAVGEGYYQTGVTRRADKVSRYISGQTLMDQASEHQEECFYGDFWGEWQSKTEGLVVTIQNAHQNFPKAISAISLRG